MTEMLSLAPAGEGRSALLRTAESRAALLEALDDAPLATRLRRQPIKDNRLRLHRLLRRGHLRGQSVEVRARIFTGQSLRVVLPEVVGTRIYRFGIWEPELTRVLLARLLPGMVFVDVGAHCGYFSLLASRLVGQPGRVFAFEPIAGTFRLLRRNLDGLINVRLEKLAVSNSRGSLRMLDFGPRLSALNTLLDRANLPDWLLPYYAGELRPMPERVQALPLDEYFGDRPERPDFVKIDAEGAGHQVLEGMVGLLTRGSPTLAIEAGDFGIEGAVRTAESVRFLDALGYRCLQYEAGHLIPCSPRETYEYGNLYFVKR